MIVYRVEKDGMGPYANPNKTKTIHKMVEKHRDNKHPTPNNDIFINRYIHYNEICGFSNVKSLKEWFFGYRAELRRLGYKMCVYDAVATGKNQVVFLNNSKRIKVLEIP
jgi:hypothetical protein